MCEYNVHWVYNRGDMNVTSGSGGSLTSVVTDIEMIWKHAIVNKLNIPLTDLKVSDSHDRDKSAVLH